MEDVTATDVKVPSREDAASVSSQSEQETAERGAGTPSREKRKSASPRPPVRPAPDGRSESTRPVARGASSSGAPAEKRQEDGKPTRKRRKRRRRPRGRHGPDGSGQNTSRPSG
jgi:hypothetical protein